MPRSILADAGPIVAMLRADDADHDRAKRFAEGFTGNLITSWPVLAEAAHFLSRGGRRNTVTLLGLVMDGALQVEDLRGTDIARMRALLAKYETMDLADASLVAIGERLNVFDVITIDRRDFAVYRTRTGRAFINHFPKTS